MKYLIYELYKTINENLSQSHNSYKIYCMLTELIFEDVGEVLDKFNKNLIAYINNEEKDIKWLKDKIENVHRVNIKNIVKVFRGYIIPGENAFNEAEADREDLIRAIIKELNIEISRESQSHIENVFMKLFGEGKVHRPDFSWFKKLVKHSYRHEGAYLTVNIQDFCKIHSVWMKNKKIIFGRDNPHFDYVFTNMITITNKELEALRNKPDKCLLQRFSLELDTRIFIEEFDTIYKCNIWKVCLTNNYSLPTHK